MTARQSLNAECAGIRARLGDKSIVFVSGNFNVVHPGHVRLLRFASERGEALVIGVNPDGGEHVHVPAELRLEGLRALEFVDHAMILPCSAAEMISALKPAVVVKGKEHEQSVNPEAAAVDSYGGRLLFGSHDHRFSSIDLIRRELEETGPPAIVKPTDFLARHAFTSEDLKSIMSRFAGMRVAVVGDLIVDEYIDCEPLGMSQEDPTLVVSPIHEARFLGGAAIVAAHARGLGAEAQLFSVGGCDEAADYAREQLGGYGVRGEILEDDSRPTTLKQRYRAEGKTLLRVSRLRQHDIAEDLCDRLVKVVRAAAASSDLLIFSDFNYGCLPTAVVDAVMETAIERRVPAVADSQSSSQMGDVSRFKRMLLLTPTEREARLAMRDFSSGLVVLAESLRRASGASNVLVKLGGEGVLAHPGEPGADGLATDRIPAMNRSPRDPAGAGDSMLTCSAMAMVAGADLWQAAYLGSVAAACQVGRVGNMPLSTGEIETELDA